MLFFPATGSPTFISSRFVDRFTILFLAANVFRLVFTPRHNDRVGRKFTFPCYVQNVLPDQNFLRCRFQFLATSPIAFKKFFPLNSLTFFVGFSKCTFVTTYWIFANPISFVLLAWQLLFWNQLSYKVFRCTRVCQGYRCANVIRFIGMGSARFMVSGNPFLVRAKQNIFNIRQLLIFIYENFF